MPAFAFPWVEWCFVLDGADASLIDRYCALHGAVPVSENALGRFSDEKTSLISFHAVSGLRNQGEAGIGWERSGDAFWLLGSGIRVGVEPASTTVSVEYVRADDTSQLQALQLAVERVFAALGILTLHAAAICIDGLLIFVVGPSGSGKSTLSTALLQFGGQVVSDDALWLQKGDGDCFQVFSGRNILSVREGTLPLLPDKLRQRAKPYVAYDGPRWAIGEGEYKLSHANAVPERILFLDRAVGRSDETAMGAIDMATALARITEASGSLYHSNYFARERANLAPLLIGLSAVDAIRVELGKDLLTDPEGVLARLLSKP